MEKKSSWKKICCSVVILVFVFATLISFLPEVDKKEKTSDELLQVEMLNIY